jgi:hypothetical protein
MEMSERTIKHIGSRVAAMYRENLARALEFISDESLGCKPSVRMKAYDGMLAQAAELEKDWPAYESTFRTLRAEHEKEALQALRALNDREGLKETPTKKGSMASTFRELREKITHSYGELAHYAGRILTHPELSRDERQEASAWVDSYLAQFEAALACRPQVYHHVAEERFAPETGLAHLVFNSEN